MIQLRLPHVKSASAIRHQSDTGPTSSKREKEVKPTTTVGGLDWGQFSAQADLFNSAKLIDKAWVEGFLPFGSNFPWLSGLLEGRR